MIRRGRNIANDTRGAAAVEFALAVPSFLLFVFVLIQLALIAYTKHAMDFAVGIGARAATLYPTPNTAAIRAAMNAKRFRISEAVVNSSTITSGYDAATGKYYADIVMSNPVSYNFGVIDTPPITLSASRRVYTQSEIS